MEKIFHIQAEDFDRDECTLLIDASESYLFYGWLKEKRLVESAFFSGSLNIQSMEQFKLARKIVAAIYSPASVFVPFKYYRDNAVELIDSLFGNDLAGKTEVEHLPEWQMYHAYKIPVHAEWLAKKKHDRHHYSYFTTVLKQSVTGDQLAVDFKKEEMLVVFMRNNQLHLAQGYQYTSHDDVLYNLLKICQSFNLQQTEVNLTLSGLIDPSSALHLELLKYFTTTQFADISQHLELSESFSELQPHYFHSLKNLAACAS